MSKRISRFYVQMPMKEGDLITLPAEVSHHLVTVLRKGNGEQIQLFNGDQNEYTAVIETISKKQAQVSIQSVKCCLTESPLKIILAQGLSKGQKMDFTLQKAVELGVHQVVPIINERSSIKLKSDKIESKLNHWNRVIISAAEQSGRCIIPQLLEPMSLEDWVVNDNSDLKIVLAPTSSKSINQLCQPESTVSLLIGSEGGLTDQEIDMAVSTGYESVKLGPRIFRTETAALVAMGVLQSLWGDLS